MILTEPMPPCSPRSLGTSNISTRRCPTPKRWCVLPSATRGRGRLRISWLAGRAPCFTMPQPPRQPSSLSPAFLPKNLIHHLTNSLRWSRWRIAVFKDSSLGGEKTQAWARGKKESTARIPAFVGMPGYSAPNAARQKTFDIKGSTTTVLDGVVHHGIIRLMAGTVEALDLAVLQEVFEFPQRQWLGKQVALIFPAAQPGQKLPLSIRFHTFGNDIETKAVAKCDDRPGYCGIVGVGQYIANERLVDFQLVQRQ